MWNFNEENVREEKNEKQRERWEKAKVSMFHTEISDCFLSAQANKADFSHTETKLKNKN